MESTNVRATVEYEFICTDNITELIKSGNINEAKEKAAEYLENKLLICNVKKTVKDINFELSEKNAGKECLNEVKELTNRLINTSLDTNENGSYILNTENYNYAIDNNLVIAYSLTDDVIELEGDTAGIQADYVDGKHIVSKADISGNANKHVIEIDNRNKGITRFTTDIPCEKFILYFGNRPWCEGIVFSVNDL